MTDDEQMAYLEGESRDYWRARAEAAEQTIDLLRVHVNDAVAHAYNHHSGGPCAALRNATRRLVLWDGHQSKDTNAAGATETRRVPRRLPMEPDCPKTPHGGDSEATGYGVMQPKEGYPDPPRQPTLEEAAMMIDDGWLRDKILSAIRAWRAAP